MGDWGRTSIWTWDPFLQPAPEQKRPRFVSPCVRWRGGAREKVEQSVGNGADSSILAATTAGARGRAESARGRPEGCRKWRARARAREVARGRSERVNGRGGSCDGGGSMAYGIHRLNPALPQREPADFFRPRTHRRLDV
jgi:hypothetical protein